MEILPGRVLLTVPEPDVPGLGESSSSAPSPRVIGSNRLGDLVSVGEFSPESPEPESALSSTVELVVDMVCTVSASLKATDRGL